MLSADRDALLCDLAETYGIYDFEALPATKLAALAVGLRENSRIKMILTGTKIPRKDVLLAGILDRLSLIIWKLSPDGKSGTNAPISILNLLLGEKKEDDKQVQAFDSGNEFDAEWEKITGVKCER